MSSSRLWCLQVEEYLEAPQRKWLSFPENFKSFNKRLSHVRLVIGRKFAGALHSAAWFRQLLQPVDARSKDEPQYNTSRVDELLKCLELVVTYATDKSMKAAQRRRGGAGRGLTTTTSVAEEWLRTVRSMALERPASVDALFEV